MSGLWDDDEEESKSARKLDLEITPARRRFLEQCEAEPGMYIWGKDPETGISIVRTRDVHDEETPIKPMPDWEYLKFVLGRLKDSNHKKKIIDKPRQLMISWLCLLWLDWTNLFKNHRHCMLNKASEAEADDMLFSRMSVIHQNHPDWFRAWARVKHWPSAHKIKYMRTGSVTTATGENVQDREARGDQASIFLIDEAARHPYLREVVTAIIPMANQVILVSTPETGSAGSRYMHEILTEGEELS